MKQYDHTQGSASDTWVIAHNLNSDAVAVDVFINDGPNAPDYEKILPLNIVATDDNTLTIYFTPTQTHTGVARIVAA